MFKYFFDSSKAIEATMATMTKNTKKAKKWKENPAWIRNADQIRPKSRFNMLKTDKIGIISKNTEKQQEEEHQQQQSNP